MKILASDFDNTLYVEDKEIFQKNITSIKDFISKGNLFCIITGRNYSNIKKELEEYQIPYSYLICEDGAKVFNNMDYCISTTMLDSSKIKEIIDILDKQEANYFLDDGYNETTNINDCVKIAVKYKDHYQAIDLMKKIKEQVEIYAYISTEHINIVDISVNKSNALKTLCNIEKLNPLNIRVIGDDINDLEMLQSFDGAIMKKHSSILDNLNKKEYNNLYEYIEELSKN